MRARCSAALMGGLVLARAATAGFLPLQSDGSSGARTTTTTTPTMVTGRCIEGTEEPSMTACVVDNFAVTRAVDRLAAVDGEPVVYCSTDGGGLVALHADGSRTTFGHRQGVRFRRARRLVATPTTVVAVGDNGCLQTLDRTTGRVCPPERRDCLDAVVGPLGLYATVRGSDSVFARRLDQGPLRPLPGAAAPAGTGPLHLVVDGDTVLAWGRLGMVGVVDGRTVAQPFLSRTQVVGVALGGDRGLVCHGCGVLSLLDGTTWRSLQIQPAPGSTVWSPFVVSGRPFVALDDGLLWYRGPHRPWRYFVGSTGADSPRGVRCAAGNARHSWFGTDDGRVLEVDAETTVLRLLARPPDAGAIHALLPSNDGLWVAAAGGAYRIAGDGRQTTVDVPSAPAENFIAVAALSGSLALCSDGTAVHLLNGDSGHWSHAALPVRATHLVRGHDGRVWCAEPGRLTRWSVSPPRRERVVAVPDEPLSALVEIPGALYGLTPHRLFRVDVRSGDVARDIWTPPPRYRLGRGRWVVTRPTCLAIDPFGVVVGTEQGRIDRVFRFSSGGSPDGLGVFNGSAVTAVACSGVTLYAACSGERGGLWTRRVDGPAEEWTRLAHVDAWNGGRVRSLDVLERGVVVHAENAVACMDFETGRTLRFDGSEGTAAGTVAAVAVHGSVVWVVGRGVSRLSWRRP